MLPASSPFRHVAVITCIFLFTTPCLFGQYFGRNKVQYDTFDFNEIESEQFRILYYDEMSPVMPEIVRMSQRWYHRLSEVIGMEFVEGDRKPLIFYANDADFQQTNIVPGFIPGGVRGLTEPMRERVVMPLTADHSVTHHVLGHELVHSFQFDYGIRTGANVHNLPLWLVEGMAEYYSLGRNHVQTSMWMRDAVLNDHLPEFGDLGRQVRYNPYRYGHALMAYLGGTYGDEAIIQYFQMASVTGLDAAVDSVFNVSPEELIEDWHSSLNNHYRPQGENRTPAEETGRPVLSEELGHGEVNLSPSLSPDGQYVAYLSQRIPIGIDLHVADAETGDIIENLGGVSEEPHLDDIRFLTSGGTWSPDSRNIAFISFARGDNEISIWNIDSGRIEQNIRLSGVPALENPAWSPDGNSIVVSGLTGGNSNLYLYNLENASTEQITDDVHSALQPAWSPDGNTIVYITDGGPGGSDLEQLDFRSPRLAFIDLETREITYHSPFGEIIHSNPQFSHDGNSLFFTAAREGILDVYRYQFDTEQLFQVTRSRTGITGVTENSPALTASADNGVIMFSVFSDDQYSIAALDPEETEGTPVDAIAGNPDSPGGILPPYEALGENIVETYLNNPESGLLPVEPDIDMRNHERRFSLSGVMSPQIGVAGGAGFGPQVGGGAGLLFADLLGDYNLGIVAYAQGTFRDIGGEISYINRRYRVNYGGAVGRTPQVFSSAFIETDEETGDPVLNRVIERMYIDRISLLGEYPLSTTQRFEGSVGVSQYIFDFRAEQYFMNQLGQIVEQQRIDLEDPDNLYFGTGSLAYVVDYSFAGFTSPIQGGRSRIQLSPIIGDARFVNLLTDIRRYAFLNPLTLAARVAHSGNFGAETGDPFSTEYLGFAYSQTYVRGYSFGNFTSAECPPAREDCPAINRLTGTQAVVANLELRIPLFGTEQFGLIPLRWLPTEISLFADAGMAWTAEDSVTLEFERESTERVPIFSSGVSSRFNLFGAAIVELYYAYPFQRPQRGWHLGFRLMPGW